MSDYLFIGLDAEVDYRVGQIAQDLRAAGRRRARAAGDPAPRRRSGRLVRLGHRRVAA